MEEKKTEEGKMEEPKAEKPTEDKKEENKAEESKEPPPQEIVLRVYMHCEGCAKKVRKCLKGFQGVEDVQTDCKAQKVVVKGEKADPVKVLERLQRKSHRKAELLSPVPKPPPPPEDAKKAEENEVVAKPEEKKPQVITVVIKVHMHCEACAQGIKRRILRMKGVEDVEPDLKSSQVTVKGVFDPPKLLEYVYKRTGKHAAVVEQEPDKKEEKKAGDGGDKKAEEAKEKKDGDGEAATAGEGGEDGAAVVELNKNELYYNFPQNHQIYPHHPLRFESYAYTPQIFSDENPNACSVM